MVGQRWASFAKVAQHYITMVQPNPNVAERELEAEGLSHRLCPYKIVGHFIRRSYLKILIGLDY